ncbi:portal protein [Streptomyces phage phiRKBJ001]|nr:portal protein [Streptomyces phage phiRKBJ001]
MSTEAVEIFLEKGRRGVLLNKDALTRAEKEIIRERFGPEGSAGVWFLDVPEESAPVEETGDFEEEQELDQDPTVVEEDSSKMTEEAAKFFGTVTDEPTMAQLRRLTIADLRGLADKEGVDLSGLQLKDDILGRMAMHFGLDPAS